MSSSRSWKTSETLVNTKLECRQFLPGSYVGAFEEMTLNNEQLRVSCVVFSQYRKLCVFFVRAGKYNDKVRTFSCLLLLQYYLCFDKSEL